ncbi:MAG: hypothetical protein D6B26_04290 [Spirochaetaceae bacterium]|nr:MAG: hypothetical protein D6B26_04290 [Spirochaetaceae bacterium]
MGMSSREVKADEEADGIQKVLIGRDTVAVIVHPENPLQALQTWQIQAIFLGNIVSWHELGWTDQPVVVFSREPGSGTRSSFESMIGFAGLLRAGAREVDGNAAVRAQVARNPFAIGYVSGGYISPEVKAVAVDGIAPGPLAAAAGRYSLVRPFYVLYSELSNEARDFLDWVLSAEGQAIVASGWVSVH